MLSTILLILVTPCWLMLALIWSVATARELRTNRSVPSVRAGIAIAARKPVRDRITAIVPAHNEQDVIAVVIASLRAQRGVDLRVVIALDRCTDGTRAAADRAIDGDARFSILEIDACPDGWPGKVNALWRAASELPQARDTDLLLFLDADVTLEPECLAAAAALRRERDLDMVTLLSTLRHQHWFERVVQPACVMELAYEFPRHRANTSRRCAGSPPIGVGSRPFVNGQFVLIDRDSYDRIGGHAALAGDIMEDFALARVAHEAGFGVGVFPADGMLIAGMYETWESFVRGWMRIFLAGSGRKVRRLRKWAWRLWLACAVLPLAVLAGVLVAAMAPGAEGWARAAAAIGGATALATWLTFLAWAYRRQRAPLWSVLVHPAGAVAAGWIQWRAARTLAARRPIPWAGKSYVFEPR